LIVDQDDRSVVQRKRKGSVMSQSKSSRRSQESS